MKKFRIEQNYTEHGTNYYEVEAESLDEAIDMVENLGCEIYKTDCHEYDCDYNGSEEIELDK